MNDKKAIEKAQKESIYSKGGYTYEGGGGVENVWIALSKTKNDLLLSERFDNQITHKQLFDYYKNSGYEIIDSNIFKVTNKDVLDVFKDAISQYIKEKHNEVVNWENTLLSYEIVGDRIMSQSCFVETKNGNEYKITPNDLVNNKFVGGGGVEWKNDAQQISLSDFEEIDSEHAPDELKTFVDPLITPMHISRKHFNEFYLDEKIYEYYDEVKLELKNGWFTLALKHRKRLVSYIKCMGEAPSFLLNLTQ